MMENPYLEFIKFISIMKQLNTMLI